MPQDDRVTRLLREYDEHADIYKLFCQEVERVLKAIIDTAGIPVSDVTSRRKERTSFQKKILSDETYNSHTDITDLAGVRIITYFEEDVDRLVEIVSDSFDVDIEYSVDKRRLLAFDQFGYQSVHLIASFAKDRLDLPEMKKFEKMQAEIQIRSLLQHAWAQIEHPAYKHDFGPVVPMKRRLARIAGLLEIADAEFNSCREAAALATADLPTCRSLGLTELVPDFTIDVQGSIKKGTSEDSLLLALNTTITNRIASPGVTEIEAAVENASVSHQNVRGHLVGVNLVEFPGVLPLVLQRKKQSARIRISGLRVNAALLGLGSTLTPSIVYA
jgi:ppGpp synthetase/RelA/SpoT-type nucleotidyltranferase